MPEPEAAQQVQWRDLQPLLDQELNGLPENYRLPILLCDLEGKVIKEAAQQLGSPQGSLAGRLARGRKLLAKRLASRGVVLSAGSQTAVVWQNVASASVPTSLMSSTVKAAAMIAAGQATVAGVVPAKVASLMEGVMKSMVLTKLSKVTMAGLVVLCLGGLGIGGFQASSAQETKTTTSTTITITTTKSEPTEDPPFFNGKNLSGWQGLPGYWKVRDGAIVGAPANGIKAHTFLCSEKTYRDFQLKFKVKRKGGIGNSGVQIRSKIENWERFTVRGPQIEIDSANWHYPPGSILTEPVGPPQIKANATTVAKVWEDDGLNDMTIRCEGKWVTVTINDVVVLDAHFPSMPEEGIIAWQLHGGSGGVASPEEIVFKDIHFRELNVANGGKTTPTHQRLWHYHSGTGAGYFLNLGDGMWLEKPCDSVFQLEKSTDDYVQLVRTDGGIRVRLPLRGSQSLCQIGDENWRNLYVGGWLSRPELNVANSGKTTKTNTPMEFQRSWARFKFQETATSVTAKECLKQLQGTWKVIATTGGGGRTVKTITFSGNRYSFDNNVAPIVTGMFQFVNLTGDPKSFDLINEGGGTAYAIFEIDGDTLYYTGNDDPTARPTDFNCRPGDGRYGHICKRVAP